MYPHDQNCSGQRWQISKHFLRNTALDLISVALFMTCLTRFIRPSMLSLEANGTFILVLRSKSLAVPKTWTHISIDSWIRFIVSVSTCDFRFFSEQRSDDQHSSEDMILLVYSLRSETSVTSQTSAKNATPVKGKYLLSVDFFCIASAPGSASVSKCWSETIKAHFVGMKGCDN